MEDNESCSSRVVESSSRQHRKKVEVYNEVLRRLKESNHPEAQAPAFDDELWAHFNRLPTRFVLSMPSSISFSLSCSLSSIFFTHRRKSPYHKMYDTRKNCFSKDVLLYYSYWTCSTFIIMFILLSLIVKLLFTLSLAFYLVDRNLLARILFSLVGLISMSFWEEKIVLLYPI